MITKDSIWIDERDNSIRLDKADEDGFHIVECESMILKDNDKHHDLNKVYVYKNEIPNLVKALWKYLEINK